MVRPAVVGDLDFAQQLWAAWWEEDPLPYRTRAATLNLQSALFLQVVHGRCQGVALVDPGRALLLWGGDREGQMQGFGVYVQKAFRRSGVGSALVQAGLTEAKRLGFQRVLLSPYMKNLSTQRWLEALGFVPLQVVMGKEL